MTEPTADVERYAAALDATLVGPTRVRRDLVREAHDHLTDATEAYQRGGYDRAAAERLAVGDFGSLDEVAPGYQTTLAVASSRRTAWLFFGALSLQPFLWDGPFSAHDGPAPDSLAYRLLDAGVEVLGGLTIAVTALLLLATGIGNRWFAAGRGIARATARITAGAAATVGLSGVAMTVLSGSAASGAHWLMLLGFLVLPMSVAATSAHRTLATT